MRPEIVVERLRQRLTEQLPGRAAQLAMAPDLSYGRHADRPAWNARPAAVMILLYRAGREWRFPLTVRPAHFVDHGGQISLPGGAVDPGETRAEAALRELDEELGIAPSTVEVLGQLSPLNLFVSNYHVVPTVAYMASPPNFRPSPAEVAELLECPVAVLLDPTSRGYEKIPGRHIPLSAPFFQLEGHHIWGATAMILNELAALWRETP